MDTTIRNLKQQAGLPPDRRDPRQLIEEARDLRARTLAALARDFLAFAGVTLDQASRPRSGHPAH